MTPGTHALSLAIAVLAVGCADNPAIWNSEVRSLMISRRGGGPPPPFIPTDECPKELVTYTLSVSPTALDASICLAEFSTEPMPIAHQAATLSLTAAQLDALVPALERLRIVEAGRCAEDAPDYRLTVTTGTATMEYADSIYAACPGGSRPAVDDSALGAVEAAFHKLAFPSPQ
jgi:hypothetical protein